MHKAAWLTGIVSGLLLGIAVTGAASLASQPHCPTEDSCRVDYYHGQYHIVEVTP